MKLPQPTFQKDSYILTFLSFFLNLSNVNLTLNPTTKQERLQEEADERVGLLKARVEALKRAREAKRASKSTNNKS